MSVVATTRLRIRDQSELLNQIAGTYKDFFRAGMEYVDNAIDKAADIRRTDPTFQAALRIEVNIKARSISFTDNCGGMSARELCDLLSEVGRSKKKTVSWANGQFGFGVHAFRAFAAKATFVSKKQGDGESTIVIDRAIDETQDVQCRKTDTKQLRTDGTRVTISHFDPQVFKKASMLRSLASEIEQHFDDVLRSGLIRVLLSEDGSRPYECKFFDFETLPGSALKRTFSLAGSGGQSAINVNLKVLDQAQDNRLPVITNKQRRIQTFADLKSFRSFVRLAAEHGYVWQNPFVVGFVEINNICSPNLTRDDFKDSPEREALYHQLLTVQRELQALVDETMRKKTQESYNKLGAILSDSLSQVLRSFRLQFEQTLPTGIPGESDRRLIEDSGPAPFGGDEPGGGGPGPNERGSAGSSSTNGTAGIGNEDTGGGSDDRSRATGEGASTPKLTKSAGPEIKFQPHAGGERIIDLGNSFIINTLHPNFIQRNANRTGKIRLDARLLNYISLVVAPPCVHRLFERKGRVPTTLEVGGNIVDLSMRLEQELHKSALGQEMETAPLDI